MYRMFQWTGRQLAVRYTVTAIHGLSLRLHSVSRRDPHQRGRIGMVIFMYLQRNPASTSRYHREPNRRLLTEMDNVDIFLVNHVS
jgi:hypothetical protein